MKFNLKMIAVAAAMVAAGAAHATPSPSYADDGGSLFVGAFNTSTNAWYVRDTGIQLNTFLPSAVTSAAGTTIDSSTVGYSGFGNNGFTSWLGAQTQADIRWFVTAVNSSAESMIASSALSNQTISNGTLSNYSGTGLAGGVVSLWDDGSGNEGSYLDQASVNVTVLPAILIAGFDNNFGLGANSLASLGNSASLFYAAANGPVAGNAATTTRYGNANQYATVSLASTGELTYTLAAETVAPSAVPVPAAAWLLGSGLLAMGGAIRRRKAAAQG